MDQIVQALRDLLLAAANSRWVGLAGAVASVAALLYAYFVRKKSKVRRRVSCMLVSTEIIRDRTSLFPRLSVSYDGESLENLTITNAMIRNSGDEVVRRSDIAAQDPLKLTVSGGNGQLLEGAIVGRSTAATNSTSRLVDNSMIIEFDFLEPKDWLRVQLIHTSAAYGSVVASGTVIGAIKPFHDAMDPAALDSWFLRLMFRFPRVVFALFFMVPAAALFAGGVFATSWLARVPLFALAVVLAWIGSIVLRRRAQVPAALSMSSAATIAMMQQVASRLSKSMAVSDKSAGDDETPGQM